MRHWEYHRTRSKVALLLVINLVALLGGKYTALITIFKLELFGEAMAFAKAPKKKPPKPHLSRVHRDLSPPLTTARHQAPRRGTPRGQHAPSHVVRHGETLASISDRPLFLGVQRRLARRTHAPATAHHAFVWPVEGILTSPFGERDHVMGGGGAQFHAGIDLSVPTGTPVRAAQEGIVVFAGYHGAYGKTVKLDHLNGFSTLYAHSSRILVHVGQTVKAGQVVCMSGSTGRSTGPHLHFEVHKDGWPIDPLPYLH
jgi:murein DD-endopeptidase MepM/ murein hydrolase activator NlpD